MMKKHRALSLVYALACGIFLTSCGGRSSVPTGADSLSQPYQPFQTRKAGQSGAGEDENNLKNNAVPRIVENTQAFLRPLSRLRNGKRNEQLTAYNSKPEAATQSVNNDDTSTAPITLAQDNTRIRIGLLLPLSAENDGVSTIAYDLLNAAQLAMFDIGRPEITLLVEDTSATSKGAAQAARNVIRNGADLIIGPLFAASVEAVQPIVRRANVPTLAFSNNRALKDKKSGKGVWLIGFLPEQNLERILREAHAQGLTRIAALIPESDYGQRIATALRPIIDQLGGELIQVETYQDEARFMFEPAQKIAHYEARKQAWADERQRLTEEAALILAQNEEGYEEPLIVPITLPLGVPIIDENTLDIPAPNIPARTKEETEEIWARLDELNLDGTNETALTLKAEYDTLGRFETFGALPYDAVLIPEGGVKLRSLAPLLPYFDVDPREIKFLGTGLWDDPVLGQEPPLIGGWYAAPHPRGWQKFAARYKSIYGHQPSRLATLAYDSISLAGALTALNAQNPFTRKNLTNPNGFQGIDGIFRLTQEGLNERGLAVLEVRRKRNRLVSSAPEDFVGFERLLLTTRLLDAQKNKPEADEFNFPFFE